MNRRRTYRRWRERCTAAGMDDFVAKPVQIDALARAIRLWLPQPVE